jgi:hypothetical protein
MRAISTMLMLGLLLGGCGGAGEDDHNCGPPVQRCGGNVMNPLQCAPGFKCVADPKDSRPSGDVGGICVPERCDPAQPQQCPDGFKCVPNPSEGFLPGDTGGSCSPVK